MTYRMSNKAMRSAGRGIGARRLGLAALCTAFVLACAGGLMAAGTGTVDKVSGWFPAGTNLTVTATPHAHSILDRWQGDTNGAVIAGQQISFSVTDTRSLTAVFKDRLTLTNAVPYWWLASVGVSSNFEAAATSDADTDGFTAAEEYWSGTDPQDGSSYLCISQVQVSSTNVRLVWAHAEVAPGLPAICIQRRASLSTGEWMYAGEKMPVDGVNTWDTLMGQKWYYRLCVTNMP